MGQADGLPLQVGDQVSDLALHEALPRQLVLLAAAAGLQHDKVSIFTEKVWWLKQFLPGNFSSHNVLTDFHTGLEFSLHNF